MKAYLIPVHPLETKSRVFHYHLTEVFLRNFPDRLVDECDLRVEVHLHPASNAFKLQINMEGTIGLLCDRTLVPFNLPIQIAEVLICRWGEEGKFEAGDWCIINEKSNTINLAPHFYDFIHLARPMKALHPEQPA